MATISTHTGLVGWLVVVVVVVIKGRKKQTLKITNTLYGRRSGFEPESLAQRAECNAAILRTSRTWCFEIQTKQCGLVLRLAGLVVTKVALLWRRGEWRFGDAASFFGGKLL